MSSLIIALSGRRLLLMGLLVMGLSGTCISVGGCAVTMDAADDQQQTQAQAVDPAEVRAEQERRRREARAARIESLLQAAEAALADDRLTIPEHDNAYDRFSAVLLLEPGNTRAETGLQAVLLRYIQLARGALRDGRVDEAQVLVSRAQDYFGGNLLLKEVQQQVAQVRAQNRERLQALNRQALEDLEYPLPPEALSRRSPELVEFLTRIAHRLRETDESVLITARSDAEGRWIYQQMNKAVPDYRVRGNIRIGAEPSLQLLPPL